MKICITEKKKTEQNITKQKDQKKKKKVPTARFEPATIDVQSECVSYRPLQKIPVHTILFFVCHPNILYKHCFQFLLGPFYDS